MGGGGGLEQTSTGEGQRGRRGQVIVLQYNMVRCTAEFGGEGRGGEGGCRILQLPQGQWGCWGQIIVLQYNMVRCTAEFGVGVWGGA